VPVPTAGTYSTAAPEADLNMNMTGLWAVGTHQLPDCVEQLADALENIATALDSVELNWAGESQKEAQDINDRWRACAVALFGSKKQPEHGVLNRIAGGVKVAALNYSLTETKIVEMWRDYTKRLKGLLNNEGPPDTGGGGKQSEPISEV
jgi:hypothetical protein